MFYFICWNPKTPQKKPEIKTRTFVLSAFSAIRRSHNVPILYCAEMLSRLSAKRCETTRTCRPNERYAKETAVHYSLDKREGEQMEAELTKRLFTVDEYHRMGRAGILHERERVELIDGEIIQMSPIGRRHYVCVIKANSLFIRAFGDRAVISPQNPLLLNDWTEPEPDVVVLKGRPDFYAKKTPVPNDVLFIVEVSDTTLSYDQTIKLPQYAAAGIPEVWMEDLRNEALHVYREPSGKSYRAVQMLRPGDIVSPLVFIEITFQVDDLLSTDYEER
jgi:Uma2 family endonuclease